MNGGVSYFGGKRWEDITREERFFCSVLYGYIKKNPIQFVEWLNKNKELNLNLNQEWDVGYEVCFYRDYLKWKEQEQKTAFSNFKKEYSRKRTFDLCMFSEDCILIIEAKSQQGFGKNDIGEFDSEERKKIGNVIGKPDIEILLLGISSTKWQENSRKYGKFNVTDNFDALLSWREMAELYKDPLLDRADYIYKN